MKKWFFGILIVLVLSACASLIKNIPRMPALTSGKDYDTVWNAALQAVDDVGYTILSSDKDKIRILSSDENGGFILAKKAKDLPNQIDAPRMIIYVTRRTSGQVLVETEYHQNEETIPLYLQYSQPWLMRRPSSGRTGKEDIAKYKEALSKRLGN